MHNERERDAGDADAALIPLRGLDTRSKQDIYALSCQEKNREIHLHLRTYILRIRQSYPQAMASLRRMQQTWRPRGSVGG